MSKKKEVGRPKTVVRVMTVGRDKQLRVKTLELPKIKPQVSSWNKSTDWLQ